MKSELINITFNSKITPVKPINESFTLCKCYVMALGKNLNQTIISKESVEDALPSLFNAPVVGHLYVDDDGNTRAGGHDVALEQDENGNYRFRAITVPYGVVPQQDNVKFEEVEEKDGTKNVYLVADIILWTGRYPELLDAIYDENVYFAQSMEILPSDVNRTKEGLEIKKFQFSALCLLGKSDDIEKNVVPCFESARVEPYKFTNEGNWIRLFTEFKELLAKSYSTDNVGKGGEKELNTEIIKKVLLELGLKEDTVLSFNAEEMTEDELRVKIMEIYPKDEQGENFAENSGDTDGDVTGKELKFSVDLTYEEKRNELNKALELLYVHNDNAYLWYCLSDFDDTYIYSYYRSSGINKAEENGYIRIPYTFIDGEAVLDMVNVEKVRRVWLTKTDEEKLEADKTQLAELVQYKTERLEADKRQEYAAILSDFSDLGELDEYKAVVKDAMTFENSEALAEKLYAIRGKNANNICKKPLDKVRIPINFTPETKRSEYDEFMSRYLAK